MKQTVLNCLGCLNESIGLHVSCPSHSRQGSSRGALNRLLWTEFGRVSPFQRTGRVFRSCQTRRSPLPAISAAPNRNKADCLPDQKFALRDLVEMALRD